MVPETASETTSYRIERWRMHTGVDALNDTDWEYLARVDDATSYTDDEPLRQAAEMRLYRVGSQATGIAIRNTPSPV